MNNIAGIATNYNTSPSVETDYYLKSDFLNKSNSDLEFDFSDNELLVELTDEENRLFDEAESISERFGDAFFFAMRGISVFPADGYHTIEDATTDFSKLAKMWIKSPNARPAIATGLRFGIVAIRYEEFIRLTLDAYRLKTPCMFPISRQERNTWRMTELSPMFIERDDYINKMMPLREHASRSRNASDYERISAEMSVKCAEYGADEEFFFFRVEPRNDLKLPSFDGFYGDDAYIINNNNGFWLFSSHSLENENTPPKPLPQELFNYLMNNSVDTIINELSDSLTNTTNNIEDIGNINNIAPDTIEECNDDGNARRFVRQHGQFVRYCVERKRWFVYDDKRWKPDSTMEIQLRAKYTARSIAEEAARAPNDKEFDKLLKHAQKTKHAKAIKDMLTMAESDLAIQENRFNKDKWLLNCSNGTIDLRTGKLRPFKREDYITK